jgi:hypothetical protein
MSKTTQITTIIIRRFDMRNTSYVLLQHKDVRFWHKTSKLHECFHVGCYLDVSLDRCNENDEGQERFGN